MNMGSKYEVRSPREKVVMGLSTDISKGFRKFFEKRGIDVDSDEFNNPVKQRPLHPSRSASSKNIRRTRV